MNFKMRTLNGMGIVGLAVLLFLLVMPVTVDAVNYYVWGRVYSAVPLEAGEEMPVNPLSSVFSGSPDQIIGEDLIPMVSRNLVKVSVVKDSDGEELEEYIVHHDGGYMISFDEPAGGVSIRLVVEELVNGKILLESEPFTAMPWSTPNIRYLLVPESLSEIGKDREFAPAAPPPAIYTAIFTRVGKIEVDYIDNTEGWVNIDSTVSGQLQIPEYEDAPFGGNLYIFGAFSQDLYPLSDLSTLSGVYYRIKVDLPGGGTEYISDELWKTKYTVDLSAGKVISNRVKLGPHKLGAQENCYFLTPIASSNNEFWSFPDLVALWRTGGRNGKHTITIEVEGVTPSTDFKGIDDYTYKTLLLDNVAPVAQILPLEPGDPDTPRVYTPGTAVPTPIKIENSRLGGYPGDYGGTADATCMIFNIQGTPTQYVAFKLTAKHSNGYMRYWYFEYERNDHNNEILVGRKYSGGGMIQYLSGIRITDSPSVTTGFEDKFLYLDASYLEPSGMSLGGCAYRFVIRAATRTTDGYNYLRWSHDQDLHYVQK